MEPMRQFKFYTLVLSRILPLHIGSCKTHSSHILTPYPGGVWHVRWLGVGKFTHPCYLLKYLPKSHQTWQFCCTSDKDQKNVHSILVEKSWLTPQMKAYKFLFQNKKHSPLSIFFSKRGTYKLSFEG